MPYYPTLDEDVARAKQILAEGRATADTLDGITAPVILTLSGGTIYGKDVYAAYRLLASFVEVIEAMDPKVIKTVMRAQRLSVRRGDVGVAEVLRAAADDACICRSTSCGHTASQHHNGVCEVCNAGICWN